MNRNKAMLASVAVLVLVLASSGVYLLWQARLWLFSTGTRNELFLNTTVGMSPAEVHRSLAKHGAQLLPYEDYRRNEPFPIIKKLALIPVFPFDRRQDPSLYMPSIEMYESGVAAEFGFTEGRLDSVRVHFDPISYSKAESVVTLIAESLRGVYQFSNREDSKQVPGAYSLEFTSATTTCSLWVNLTEPKEPIIILDLWDPKTQANRKQQIQEREHSAFGTRK